MGGLKILNNMLYDFSEDCCSCCMKDISMAESMNYIIAPSLEVLRGVVSPYKALTLKIS